MVPTLLNYIHTLLNCTLHHLASFLNLISHCYLLCTSWSRHYWELTVIHMHHVFCGPPDLAGHFVTHDLTQFNLQLSQGSLLSVLVNKPARLNEFPLMPPGFVIFIAFSSYSHLFLFLST